MKPSETFRKGNPLKSYEIQRARGQKNVQKFRNETSQGKRDDKVYMTKLQGKNNPSDSSKNYCTLNSINFSNIPVISSFEKKIRQAIQVRYHKSKIKDFKYDNRANHIKNKEQEEISTIIQDQNLIKEDEEKSEDMEEMIKFSYLRDDSFVSIHQYHASKLNQKRQSTIYKESIRKRKFRIVNQKSIESREGFYSSHTKSIQKIPLIIEHELNSLSPKEQNLTQVDLKVLKSNLKERAGFDDEKRKSLSSRQSPQLTSFINSDTAFDQKQCQSNLKTSSYIIKDTFKLKSANKFRYKDEQQYNQTQTNPNHFNYGNQKSGRTQSNKRRLLLQKNQKKQSNIQAQKSPYSQIKLPFNYQSIPKTQNKKIFSYGKIQTQISQQPQEIYKKTPGYKYTKEKIKTQQAFANQFQTNEIQMNRSSTEQKWKLQEISFRFKPINEQNTQLASDKMNNFIEQNQKAVKMGFSLEKAYNKILSGRKIERKQTPNFDNRRTIGPKNQHNSQKMETIAHQITINREERSVSKNKRRKLRLRTEFDLESEKTDIQGISTVKKLTKNIQTPKNSSLIEAQIKEPIPNLKQRQKREFLATNYRSKHKVDRFSTIS